MLPPRLISSGLMPGWELTSKVRQFPKHGFGQKLSAPLDRISYGFAGFSPRSQLSTAFLQRSTSLLSSAELSCWNAHSISEASLIAVDMRRNRSFPFERVR